MIDHLAALTKRIAELRQYGLEVCHCVKELYVRQICPLDRRKILAFEYPRMADSCRESSEGCLSVLSPYCC
jgi:hypothetical protein